VDIGHFNRLLLLVRTMCRLAVRWCLMWTVSETTTSAMTRTMMAMRIIEALEACRMRSGVWPRPHHTGGLPGGASK
jgi:hypothetical protein